MSFYTFNTQIIIIIIINKNIIKKIHLTLKYRSFSIPLYYPPELVVKCFETSATLYEIINQYLMHVKQYIYLYTNPSLSKILNDSTLSFEEFSWCVGICMTRQNQIPIGGTDENPIFGLALIPV